MYKVLFSLLCFNIFSFIPAQEVQWASKLIDFSSEYRTGLPENSSNFKASQILGFPNTMVYGISTLAWTPAGSQVGKEYVLVSFDKPQYVQQIIIGETYNAGAVKEIILYDEKGKSYLAYENKNPGPRNNYGQVLIPYKIAPTTYKVQKLKLVLNTDKVGGMQQIDCIGISSSAQPVKLKVNEVFYKEAIAQPENLGPNINSEYYDHLPILSPDEQLIYFARKWAESNTGEAQKDDIYFAYQLQNGAFTKAENIGSPLNTEEHNFVVFVSKDNNRLYLANRYRKNNMTGVSVSSKDKFGKWQKPVSLYVEDMYNNNEYAHYHLNLAEDVLLMCVERLDGLGDLDIFVSFKYADGTWSKPKNLGKTINTVGSEASVFLAADGKTLFFSSSGHQGYGSYDMYVSKRLDNTWTNWSTPLNLGTKINTEEMDIYYTVTSNGEYAYFSSGKSYFGKNDLYRIKLPKEIQPEPVIINNPQILANSIQKKSQAAPTQVASTTTIPTSPKPATATNTIPKLDTIKKPISSTITPTITPTTTLTNSTPTQPISQPKVVNNPKTDDLQKKLDSLKNIQNQKPTVAVVPQKNPTATEQQVVKKDSVNKFALPSSAGFENTMPKKDSLVNKNALPTSATLELPKKANQYAVDSFKNIPKVVNNDPQKNVFDNLKKQPNEPVTQNNNDYKMSNNTLPNANYDVQTQDFQSVKPEEKSLYTIESPTTNTPQPISMKSTTTLSTNTPQNPTITSTQTELPKQSIDNNLVNNTTLKPKQEQSTDPYAEKLAQLKNKQYESKLQDKPSNTTTDYSKYTERKDYNNPTIDVSNNIDPKKNDMQQKLQNLNTPTYEESKKLENPNVYKPYEKQPLKEKQADTYAQQYDDMQDKIAQLKQQQQQQQTSNTKAPKKSEIKVDNTNPDIKYIPKENPTTTFINNSAEPNPQVLKYQEKLKAIQDKMNNIDSYNPNIQQQIVSASKPAVKQNNEPSNIQQKINDLNSKTEAIANQSDIVLNTTTNNEKPIETIVVESKQSPYQEVINQQPKEDELNKHLEQIEQLKKEQEQLNQQLNNTLNNLNDNKSSLEKDIDELANERNKLNQQLNNTLTNLNDNKNILEKDINNLNIEKDKLDEQKKTLEKSNAQLADEKSKLEQDKKVMDELLAQMQAEKDKIAAEKAKLEKDKQLLELLRKQQEKEVTTLSKNIDSLKKVQQKAIDANAQIQRYEILEIPIEEGAIAIMKSIYFMADASFLQTKSFPELDKLVAFLKQNPKIQKIEIGGHTNGLCDDVFCTKLSNDRAKSVMDYLIRNGIDANKLSFKGYGKQYLISKPADPVNQRVEVKIISVKES